MAYLDYPAIFSFGLFSPKDFHIIWLSQDSLNRPWSPMTEGTIAG
jgi:hypothetical protein